LLDGQKKQKNWDSSECRVPYVRQPWSKAWVCGRLLVGIAGSNSAGSMGVCCECCVLSGRGL